MLSSSNLSSASCAPRTLDILAKFCVLTRLKEHENSTQELKMRVYNGENVKDKAPSSKLKSYQEYRDSAGVDEGMNGISTRFAFKTLSDAFNYDNEEVACDPVHLMLVLKQRIIREQFDKDTEEKYLDYIDDFLTTEYAEYIGNEIQKAFLASYDDYGQNLFDRYVSLADAWIEEADFRDSDTGQSYNRSEINEELEKIEKPAGLANPKDFRNEIVKYVYKTGAKTGKKVNWTSYQQLREVIEAKMFASTEELLPVISYGTKKSEEEEKKHSEFVDRMVKNGYTIKQTRRLTDWFSRVRKSN